MILIYDLKRLIHNIDKKLFFFCFANGISLLFGLFLYLLVITNSDQNLAKLMFCYSIHLILGSILTFGSNLYIFNDLSSKNNLLEKINILEKNIFFLLIVLSLGLFLVGFLSILDFFFSPYKKNFNLHLYPFFFTAFIHAINKILYFCYLGFKFFKYCYIIIIIKPIIIFSSIAFFIFFTNFSFEISVLVSLTIGEVAIFLFCIKKLKKVIHINSNLFKNEYKKQTLNSIKLFGEYIFAEIILKIDIFFSMLRFELKNISIYLIALVFIEGLLTFTIVIRNYFSSQYSALIIKKKYADYIKQFKKYSFYSLMTAIFFTLCSVLLLIIMNKYLIEINFLVFKYLGIMIAGYLIYSYFAISELIFLNEKNYLKQTFYFISAILMQILVILLFINSLGILSFSLAIFSMYLFMSIFVFIELFKINSNCNR